MDKNTSSKNLTVMDNINFWRGLSSSKLKDDEALLLLENFNIYKYKNTKVMYLSSGEIKKLELLRLIIEGKKVWLLDEPFTNLDRNSIEVIEQTFDDHCRNNGSIIFSSHQDLHIRVSEEINL